MANNCLVTKLNSVVNNDNLEILNGYQATLKSDGTGLIYLSSVSGARPVHVYAPDVTITGVDLNGRVIDAHNAEVTTLFYISENSKSFRAIITDIHNLGTFKITPDSIVTSTKCLKNAPDLKQFIISINTANTPAITVNFNDIHTENLETINIISNLAYNMSFTGSINELVSRCSTDKLKKVVCKLDSLIEGNTDISTLLGEYTSVTNMSFYYCANMTGTVENFVAAQVINGRTTCNQIAIGEGGTLGNVTFNGEAFTGITGTTSMLKWKPTTSSAAGAVTDVCLNNTALTISSDGTKIADATPW